MRELTGSCVGSVSTHVQSNCSGSVASPTEHQVASSVHGKVVNGSGLYALRTAPRITFGKAEGAGRDDQGKPRAEDDPQTDLSSCLGFVLSRGSFRVARTFSGPQLRARRVAAGLRPEQLALRIDRSVFSVHQYERGTAHPSVPVLGALADQLGCSIDDLFAREAVASGAA
ncbi:helix-turn-helix domain-containing protein [Actinoplanes sp. NPDC051494]|uniref:helix-turn-helix domain-containing protein n=1 Tax=Actinoplanes sp. NPDC051494 TaxID=3363907 RepID=UPI0037B137CC